VKAHRGSPWRVCRFESYTLASLGYRLLSADLLVNNIAFQTVQVLLQFVFSLVILRSKRWTLLKTIRCIILT
jgi:hypothetical protein